MRPAGDIAPERGQSTPPRFGVSAELVALVALGVLTVVLRLVARSHSIDDAYITFRYAANLASGHGLVYNPGEQVLGTTAPLFAIVLAFASLVSGIDDYPTLAHVVSALADGTSCVLIVVAAQRLRLPLWAGFTAGILFGISPLVIRYSIGGMETSFVVLVLMTALVLYFGGSETAAFHLAGLAMWLRVDMLALAAGLVLSEAMHRRRLPTRQVVVLAGWIIVYGLVLTLEYQLPVPHSVVAKSGQAYAVQPLTNFLQFVYFSSGLTLSGVQGFGARVAVVDPSPAVNAIGFGLLLPLSILWFAGLRRILSVTWRGAVVPAYGGLVAMVYSVVGLRGSLMAEWYLVPLAPIWILPFVAGLVRIREGLPRGLLRAAALAPAWTLIALQLVSLNWFRNPDLPATIPQNVWVERELLYEQVGRFLRPRLAPGQVVAAPEIGALGYTCACPILDTVGLVSPGSLAYYLVAREHRGANYAVPVELIDDLKPSYLVSLDVFLRETLLADRNFLETYREIWAAEIDAFGSEELLVFERQPDR